MEESIRLAYHTLLADRVGKYEMLCLEADLPRAAHQASGWLEDPFIVAVVLRWARQEQGLSSTRTPVSRLEKAWNGVWDRRRKGLGGTGPGGGQRFDCATWVHKSRSKPREEFRREVEKELTGRETEPHELIYFKVYSRTDPGDRADPRNSGLDARKRQIARVLFGDNLCGLPGRHKPG